MSAEQLLKVSASFLVYDDQNSDPETEVIFYSDCPVNPDTIEALVWGEFPDLAKNVHIFWRVSVLVGGSLNNNDDNGCNCETLSHRRDLAIKAEE